MLLQLIALKSAVQSAVTEYREELAQAFENRTFILMHL
jgi:hypothetical protein